MATNVYGLLFKSVSFAAFNDTSTTTQWFKCHGHENNSYHDNVFGSIPLLWLSIKKRNHCSFCWSPIFIFEGSFWCCYLNLGWCCGCLHTSGAPNREKFRAYIQLYISHRCTGTWSLKHRFQFHRHKNFNGVWSLTILNGCSVAKEIMLSSCKMFLMVYLRMSEDVWSNLCCLAACVSICIQFISKVFILYRTDLQWSCKAYRDYELYDREFFVQVVNIALIWGELYDRLKRCLSTPFSIPRKDRTMSFLIVIWRWSITHSMVSKKTCK